MNVAFGGRVELCNGGRRNGRYQFFEAWKAVLLMMASG